MTTSTTPPSNMLQLPIQAAPTQVSPTSTLPKSCTLLLLRFTKEDGKNTKGEDYREGPHSNPTSPAEQSERSIHNF